MIGVLASLLHDSEVPIPEHPPSDLLADQDTIEDAEPGSTVLGGEKAFMSPSS